MQKVMWYPENEMQPKIMLKTVGTSNFIAFFWKISSFDISAFSSSCNETIISNTQYKWTKFGGNENLWFKLGFFKNKYQFQYIAIAKTSRKKGFLSYSCIAVWLLTLLWNCSFKLINCNPNTKICQERTRLYQHDNCYQF